MNEITQSHIESASYYKIRQLQIAKRAAMTQGIDAFDRILLRKILLQGKPSGTRVNSDNVLEKIPNSTPRRGIDDTKRKLTAVGINCTDDDGEEENVSLDDTTELSIAGMVEAATPETEKDFDEQEQDAVESEPEDDEPSESGTDAE